MKKKIKCYNKVFKNEKVMRKRMEFILNTTFNII